MVARVESRDVIVLGGGPGGATVAACLARRGRAPLLLERDRFPRYHIGESLLPRSCEVFEELGLRPALDALFMPKRGARFHCATTGRTVRYAFSEAFDPVFAHAYQVPRAAFDELLLRRAVELGAEVREGWEAVDVRFEGDRGVVRARRVGDEETTELSARVVVDSTGRDALLASKSRRKTKLAGLDKTALYTHYEGAARDAGEEEGDIQIVVFDAGWFWFIPFLDGVTSVGAVCSSAWMRGRAPGESLDDLFDRAVAIAPVATQRLAGARRLRPVGALADFSYRVDALVGDGWLNVGDAAGFVDPLFSTGAHLAIKGGQLAAAAIDAALTAGACDAAAFADYERAVRAAVDTFLGVVQGFYEGPVRETIFEPNQRATMRRIITSILSGDVFHGAAPPAWVGFVRERFPAVVTG